MNVWILESRAGLGVGRVKLKRPGEPGAGFAFAAQPAAEPSDLIEPVGSELILSDAGGQQGEVLEATMVLQGRGGLVQPARRAEGLGQPIPHLGFARGQPHRLAVNRDGVGGFSL